jgi:hypothetical protein
MIKNIYLFCRFYVQPDIEKFHERMMKFFQARDQKMRILYESPFKYIQGYFAHISTTRLAFFMLPSSTKISTMHACETS